MEAFYLWIDTVLIVPFKLIGVPILGYYFGCFTLALLCVLLGQFTIAVAYLWNRRFIQADNHSMVSLHNASMKALAAKDKGGYKKCNKAANDAFGKVFFAQIALAASSLWPLPFAMGWMQTRFLHVEFTLPVKLPIVGETVGYLFTFLPIYILVFILFGKVKARLPFFRRISCLLDLQSKKEEEKMIFFSDLAASAQPEPRQHLGENKPSLSS